MANPKFHVNGKPLRLNNGERIREHLDKLPLGHMVTSTQLASATEIHPADFQMRHPDNAGYRVKHNNVLYWGSKKTVQKFNREMGSK